VTTPGKEHVRSKWHEGQTIHVTVADKEHPITRGLADFTIHDETYGEYDVLPSIRVLLTTDQPENAHTIAWANEYGKSRIFYFQLGHDSNAWRNPAYPEILRRGIRWAAGR
jgi:type 1 glutamine amidotransferase